MRAIRIRRSILVIDDELINREMLRFMLEQDYDVLAAANGAEALAMLEQHMSSINLVLLDLLLPDIHGLEILRWIKSEERNPLIQRLPVIVMTSEQSAEVESLRLGAIDFIPKPYPQPEVVRARVRRTIELSEDRQIIKSTERDVLTGLYNREYFYRYGEQFDQHHQSLDMDAVVLDICNFHMINERYGRAYGDQVLRRIGELVREMVRDTGGIVCRREADTFLIYCPHGKDYEAILESASISLSGDEDEGKGRVRLRMGVYASVDKEIEIERRFDRAKLAADKIHSSVTRRIALYDEALHEAELFDEQLIEDFQKAVEEKQFQVYFQPKMKVQTQVPTLASAEALIRWNHPVHGMLSPGRFIPLFERNGLVQKLDHYVWENTAAQIADWRKRLGRAVPVSVNVSRVDMFDEQLPYTFEAILSRYGLEPRDLLLEITESAYTDDSAQIISMVKKLRSMGFRIEMDDFGTGYSSLGMLSNLPIDVLKLDMGFVRSAFGEKKDSRMVRLIIDIADTLSVDVVAEGVETWEQVEGLKAMGCDIIQGYYFSKPVPADQFERFLLESGEDMAQEATDSAPARKAAEGPGETPGQKRAGNFPEREMESPPAVTISYEKISEALAADYFSIYYVNTETNDFVEYISQEEYEGLGIEQSGENFFEQSRENIEQLIYPEDRAKVLQALKKDTLLKSLKKNPVFTISYRLLMNSRPVYVSMKVTRMSDPADPHIVVGVANIDDQMRMEEQYQKELRFAREKAFRDPLTGVKSSVAFTEQEGQMDLMILSGEKTEFAVVSCRLSGIASSGRGGNEPGTDELIKKACEVVCKTYKHSPVFRVSTDEFTAILRGEDYHQRDELLRQMWSKCLVCQGELSLQIGSGMAVYDPERDRSFASVYQRAKALLSAGSDQE